MRRLAACLALALAASCGGGSASPPGQDPVFAEQVDACVRAQADAYRALTGRGMPESEVARERERCKTGTWEP